MKRYLRDRYIRIGVGLVVVGWGPLLTIIFLSTIGLWPDPNPNPIGPGILFMLTAWPAIICLGIGFFKVRREPPDSSVSSGSSSWKGGIFFPAARGLASVAGLGLTFYGISRALAGEGRGAASAAVIGVALFYWAVVGRMPAWFSR